MEIKPYLTPATIEPQSYQPHQWGNYIKQCTESGFPDLDGVKIAILGVNLTPYPSPIGEGAGGEVMAADKVREHFYKLSSIPPLGGEGLIADLGNLIPGKTTNDTNHAVEFVCSELLKNNIIPIIIGDSQDLTYPNYLAYQKLQPTVNIVCINSTFTIQQPAFLSKIIKHPSAMLFNLSLVGYQTYFVNNEEIEMLQKMYFDTYRLGLIQSKMEEAEPIVRNADILSFALSSIRQSDAPGCANTTPNGLYGEEACQIMRYAGMSDKLSTVGIYELNPEFDNRGQTAYLAAQMLWYFLEGFSNRKNDIPDPQSKDYLKYIVTILGTQNFVSPENEIVFYKSLKTDRWWMEVPKHIVGTIHESSPRTQPIIMPCSYDDYLLACTGEMPDRWWQAYQKLN